MGDLTPDFEHARLASGHAGAAVNEAVGAVAAVGGPVRALHRVHHGVQGLRADEVLALVLHSRG